MDLTENEDAWKEVVAFTLVSSAPSYQIKSLDQGFLRCVRWSAKAASMEMVEPFWIKGVARRYGSRRGRRGIAGGVRFDGSRAVG